MEETSGKASQFANELAQFYRNKGQLGVTSKDVTVRLDGQDIDLWQVYSAVLELGGSYKVNQHSLWEEVYTKVFRRRPSGVNVSVALRQIYQRYLMPYERIHCSHFTVDNGVDEDEDSKSSSHHHHQSSSREQSNLFVIHSSLTPHPSSLQNQQQHLGSNPVTRLICSLVSGLANEMDFGLKIVSMLVNSRQLNAIADFRFIDILLESCRLRICKCESEDLSIRPYSPTASPSKLHHLHRQRTRNSKEGESTKKCLCFQRFWSRICHEDAHVLSLIFQESNEECKSLQDDELSILNNENQILSLDEEEEKTALLFKRITDMIRAITEFMHEMDESEEDPISDPAPLSLVKLVSLLISSSDSEMKTLGLDIASNITLTPENSGDPALYLALETYICTKCVSIVADDSDADVVTRGLKCLAHLISSDDDRLLKTFKDAVDSLFLGRLIELLTSQHDVSLVVATLELCLSISEVSPKLLISSSCLHLIKLLLNLVNCDVNVHFGSEALAKIRVSDQRPLRAVPQITRVLINPTLQQQVANKTVTVAASPLNNPTTASESEAFLISWLRNAFDVTGKTGQAVSLHEMFGAYLKYACNSGRRSVINAQSFSQVVVKAFPSVVCTASHVEGIAPKVVASSVLQVVPAINSIPASPATVVSAPCLTPKKTDVPPQTKNPLTSPILKAHLSAPPKASPPGQTSSPTDSPVSSSGQEVVTTTSGTTPTSSLIKSLLASKLRNNSVSTKLDFSDSPSDPSSPVVKTPELPSVTITSIPSVSLTSSSALQSNVVTVNSVSTTGPSTPQKMTVVSSIMTSNSNSNLILTSSPSTAVSMSQMLTSTCSQQVLFSTPTMTNNVMPGQTQVAPQQFLLVRTIMPGGGPGSLVGMPTGGPVRLILPASVLTQQRPVPPIVSVNGVVGPSQTIPSQAVVTTSPPPTVTTTTTSSLPKAGGDILLKAVLGSGINNESTQATLPTTDVSRNCIKSSPLLNVLLDKGTTSPSQTPASQVSPGSQQQAKMFILATKSGVAVKPPGPDSIQVGLKNGSSENVLNHVHPEKPVVSGVTTLNCTGIGHLTNGEVTDSLCLDEKKLVRNNNPTDFDLKTTEESTYSSPLKRPIEETEDIIPKKTKVNESLSEPTSIPDPDETHVNGEAKSPPKTSENSTVVEHVVQQSTTVATNGPVTAVQTSPPKLEFVCEWNGCKKSFTKATRVFLHVYENHVFINCTAKTATNNDELSCEWGGPHGMGPGCQSKRPRLSLLTHLQDFHCNPTLLHQTAVKRIQLGAPPTVNVALSQPPPAHPGYAKNAALLAIKRHAVNYIEPWPTLAQTTTAPVTVSVRLTAALIMRNLAIISSDVRRWLQRHEALLSELAMNIGRDESRTLAQCLAIIQTSVMKR